MRRDCKDQFRSRVHVAGRISMNILRFLNLLGKNDKLSITNITVLVMLVKIAFIQHITLTESAAFFITLLNYGHKRVTSAQYEKEASEDITNKINALQLEVNEKLNSFAETAAKVEKVSEDTKKVLSNVNLQGIFVKKG